MKFTKTAGCGTLLSFVVLFFVNFPVTAHTNNFYQSGHSSHTNFVQVDLTEYLGPLPYPEYKTFVNSIPEGLVTLSSNVPFYFPREKIVNIASSEVSIKTNLHKVEAIHLLINTTGTFLTQISPGEKVGRVRLIFDEGKSVEITPLIVGSNIREWRQIGDCGPTINTITSENAKVEYMGKAPNPCNASFTEDGTGLAVIDKLSIPVHKCKNNKVLTSIVIEDFSSSAVTILLNAVTAEVEY